MLNPQLGFRCLIRDREIGSVTALDNEYLFIIISLVLSGCATEETYPNNDWDETRARIPPVPEGNYLRRLGDKAGSK